MRKAAVHVHDLSAGVLEEIRRGAFYRFEYFEDYAGPPVSLTMPLAGVSFEYTEFPPFFEGLLPEGYNLDTLLRAYKIDARDLFSQLMAVGMDLVGAVTVKEIE